MVIGISTDILALQQKFTDKETLNFPLLADTDGKVTKSFGILNAKNMANRATFVIDKEGKLAKIYNPVKGPGSHAEETLEFVKTSFGKKKS